MGQHGSGSAFTLNRCRIFYSSNLDMQHMRLTHTFQINLSARRKNRMKRDTAAIIAAERDRTTSVYDDTEGLIINDSVVVYDERTAL